MYEKHRPLLSYDRPWDEIDRFIDCYGTEIDRETRAKFIRILSEKYPLIVENVDKIKTSKRIDDHQAYMRLARILYEMGYQKIGHWFIFGGEK